MASLNTADFFDKLKIESFVFGLNDNQMYSQDGAGQLLVSSIGPRLWIGSYTLSSRNHSDYEQQKLLVQQLQNPGVSFIHYNFVKKYPASYKATDVLDSVTMSNSTSGYTVTLNGLPAGYKLKSGDYFSFQSSGVYQLHQIAKDATANVSGSVAVSVLNPVPAGLVNNIGIQLKYPRITARIMPKSASLGVYNLGYGGRIVI